MDQLSLYFIYFVHVTLYGAEFVFFVFQCVNVEDVESFRSRLTNV